MLGLTQQQVAEMLGITYQQLHKYEKGVNRISAGRLHALARALGVDVGYFYEGLGSGEPARPTARQRQMLELARSFAVLPRRQQEALAEMARALAKADAGRERLAEGELGEAERAAWLPATKPPAAEDAGERARPLPPAPRLVAAQDGTPAGEDGPAPSVRRPTAARPRVRGRGGPPPEPCGAPSTAGRPESKPPSRSSRDWPTTDARAFKSGPAVACVDAQSTHPGPGQGSPSGMARNVKIGRGGQVRNSVKR